MSILDHLPVASITFIAGVVLIIIGYANNNVGFEDAFKALLYLGGGSAGIGYVRNGAGKGVRGVK